MFLFQPYLMTVQRDVLHGADPFSWCSFFLMGFSTVLSAGKAVHFECVFVCVSFSSPL